MNNNSRYIYGALHRCLCPNTSCITGCHFDLENLLDSSPAAALTMLQKAAAETTEIHCLAALEPGSLRSGCQQSRALPAGSREKPARPLPAPIICWQPCCSMACRRIAPITWPLSCCVTPSVSKLPALGPKLMTSS